MPVKTVTLQVVAVTDKANREIAATGAYFEKLRDANPVELKVKLDRLQAIAESKIIAAEMATTVRDTVKLDFDRSLGSGFITGLLGRGGFGGRGGGLLGLVGAAGGGGLGFAGLGALGSASLPVLTGIAAAALSIIPALVAAGAAGAAFGAAAIPTFMAVTGAISGVTAANGKFQEAAQNVDIAISTSHADLVLYNDALAKMPANLAAATRLLGNQNVTWQALTTSQQNNVIALSQNKSALGSLLPAQKTALDQLLASKAVWDQLSPVQQQVAIGWQNITTAYHNLVVAVAPDVLSIMNSGLKIAASLLPAILPLAKAGGGALSGLATHLAGFFKLADTQTSFVRSGHGLKEVTTQIATPFGEFVQTLSKLSGPAITAIGIGIGQIAASLGKLLLALTSPTAIRDLRVFFEAVAGIITGLADFLNFATPRWNNNLRSMTNFGRTMERVFEDTRAWIEKNFVQVLVRFFTSTLPAAFDLFKEYVRLVFDKVAIFGLESALLITTAFGHLPGPLGAPFRAASAVIRAQLAGAVADSANAVANIKADFAKLNGTKANLYVYTNFVNVGSPPATGGIFPTPSGLPPGTHHLAGGTSFAAPGWALVGERGPELLRMRGGETVIPGALARGGPASVNVTLEIRSSGQSDFDRFMTTWLQKSVVVRGGGSVQAAWGAGTG